MKKSTAHGRKLKRLQAHVQPGRAIAAHASPVGRAVIVREEIDSVTELMCLGIMVIAERRALRPLAMGDAEYVISTRSARMQS